MKIPILFCMTLLLLATGCKEEVVVEEPIRPVRVFTVDGKADRESRTYPGKVKATREASLAFRLSGQVVRLNVKEGDFVKKGQLIAMLDQRDYQAALADLQAQLNGARTVLKETSQNIKRNEKLLKERIIAQSAYDTALSTYETSRSKVLSLEQSIRRARLNLQYTRLEAPFSGVIAKKHTSNHEFVQAKEAIVDLEDNSSLDVVVDVPESVWARAFKLWEKQEPSVFAHFESIPSKRFPLKYKEHQTNANPETQTYEVTLTFTNPEGSQVYPGMTAEIEGNMPEVEGTTERVFVPFASVTGKPGGRKYVWILGGDNKVIKREVTVGRVTDDMFQVTDGVEPGDVIVTAGVNYLREGQEVKVLRGRIGGRQ